jgi:O-antigen/teichoic acid export membrane protein
LIPQFSYVGASFATVITEAVILPILIYYIWKNGYTNLKPLAKDLPKIIFSCIFMTIFLVALNGINLFLLIIIALIIYFGTIYITKTLDDRDILILNNIRKRK